MKPDAVNVLQIEKQDDLMDQTLDQISLGVRCTGAHRALLQFTNAVVCRLAS